jgi:plastocyanin
MDLVPDADDGPHAQQTKWNRYMHVGCGNTPYYPGTPPCIFDGRTTLSSGYLAAPVDPKTGHLVPGRALPSFTAPPGFYNFTCLVRFGMSGYLTVVGPHKQAPSPQSQFHAGQQQYLQDLKVALAVEAGQKVGRQRHGSHSTWMVQAGIPFSPSLTAQINEMVPATLRIKRGDTVMWMGEMHTVTFPAETGLIPFHQVCERRGQADVPVLGTASGCQIETEVNPRAYDPSSPSGRAYTGGFYNSGFLSMSNLTGDMWSITFPRAGTYHYDCLMHWGMDGTIIVR